MDLTQYILLGLVLFVGSMIQSAAGFAFGLFAIPLLLLAGLPAYAAIPLIAVCAWMQALTGAIRMRGEPNWRQLLWLLPIGVAMQPVGVWLLSILTEEGPAIVQQVFGSLVLAVVAVQWRLRPKPRDHVHAGWGVTAMLLAGLLSGLSGMSGPPIVFWVMAHSWSSRRMRATLWVTFMTMAPTNVVFQSLRFGPQVWEAAGLGLAYTPIVWLAMWPGMWLGNRLSQDKLRRISFAMLALIGLYMLAQPWFTRASTQANETTESSWNHTTDTDPFRILHGAVPHHP